MGTSEDRAVKHIPQLRDYLHELVELSATAFVSPPAFDPHNHFAFMALSFATKQSEHARSVLVLGDSVDAVLVTRSMFEGLSQLLWAAQAPNERPLRWRSFTVILDWRLMRKRLGDGEPLTEDVTQRIEGRAKDRGAAFLSSAARKAVAKGSPLPADPYMRNWYDETERDVFDAVGGDRIYKEIYGQLSEYHHWRPGAFGRLLNFDAERTTFVFTTHDPTFTATALAGAFQCLWQTMQLLDREIRAGIASDLDNLHDRYVALGKDAAH